MRAVLIGSVASLSSGFLHNNGIVTAPRHADSMRIQPQQPLRMSGVVESVAEISQHLTSPAMEAMMQQQQQQPSGHMAQWVQHALPSTITSPPSSWLTESYSDMLRDCPVATKSITAAVVAAIGDFVAQKREQGADGYDAARGVAFALFSASYAGVFQHHWFHWLNTEFTALLSTATAASCGPGALAAAKLFLNQAFVVPAVYMPLFFALTGALGGLTVEASYERAKALYMPILAQKYAFWLPAQFIQFAFVDPEWQITYLCSVGLLWTVILSSVGGTVSPPPSLSESKSEAITQT